MDDTTTTRRAVTETRAKVAAVALNAIVEQLTELEQLADFIKADAPGAIPDLAHQYIDMAENAAIQASHLMQLAVAAYEAQQSDVEGGTEARHYRVEKEASATTAHPEGADCWLVRGFIDGRPAREEPQRVTGEGAACYMDGFADAADAVGLQPRSQRDEETAGAFNAHTVVAAVGAADDSPADAAVAEGGGEDLS